MKFIALDPVVRQEFATNVNVVTPLPAGLTFDTYRRGSCRRSARSAREGYVSRRS